MEKSHVSLGFKVCPVCGKEVDDCVILDKRLKNTLERKTYIGLQLCDEHLKEGFVQLIEIDSTKSSNESVFRTGRTALVKNETFQNIFDKTIPSKSFGFIDIEAFEKLIELYESTTI